MSGALRCQVTIYLIEFVTRKESSIYRRCYNLVCSKRSKHLYIDAPTKSPSLETSIYRSAAIKGLIRNKKIVDRVQRDEKERSDK